VELNGVLSQVSVFGDPAFKNSLVINTLNNDGVSAVCHSSGCFDMGMGGLGVVWKGMSNVSINFGDGNDVISVISLGADPSAHNDNITLIINGAGGSDSFAITANATGFDSLRAGQIIFLDSMLDSGAPSDGTCSFIIDACE
jgi:hypothetical protein